jgi:CubicO group peptidase (beta-lactamase class C family)
MITKRRNTPLAASALALLLFATAAAVAKADPIDDYLRAEMERNHIPAVSVAVVRDGRIVKLKAYGKANLEWDAPATTDTAFPLASATKPLTATALMLLVQDGNVSLDDPVGRHLPDAPAAWDRVTVRHLASHTSGIPDDFGQASVRTAAEGFTALAKRPLDFAPGTRAAYGLGGYVVLQHLIERATGMPFDAFLRERVFAPLGMRGARFDNAADSGPARAADLVPRRAADLVPRRAGVYEWSPAGGGAQRNFAFPFPAHGHSAGGLYASAADLARWAVALDTGRLLAPATRDRMWTPGRLADGSESPFAVGWAVGAYRGRRTVGHSGGPALADVLRFVDDKLTIVVLANQQRMYPYLAQGVADRIVPAPPATPDPAPVADDDPETTASLLALLRGFAEGRVDPAPIAPDARPSLVGMIENFAMPWLRALGPLRSLTLLSDTRAADGRRVRRYRARYDGDKPVLWKFDLDADGRIVSLSPTPE